MHWFGSNVLTVIVAAAICSILSSIIDKKGMIGEFLKLIFTVFMLLSVVSPFLDLRFDHVGSLVDDFSIRADQFVAQGSIDAAQSVRKLIIEKTEAYILDKAQLLGAQISVEVMVEDSILPTPCSVTIRGSISPYGKSQLQALLRDDLGISMEDQVWLT